MKEHVKEAVKLIAEADVKYLTFMQEMMTGDMYTYTRMVEEGNKLGAKRFKSKLKNHCIAIASYTIFLSNTNKELDWAQSIGLYTHYSNGYMDYIKVSELI